MRQCIRSEDTQRRYCIDTEQTSQTNHANLHLLISLDTPSSHRWDVSVGAARWEWIAAFLSYRPHSISISCLCKKKRTIGLRSSPLSPSFIL